MVGLTRWDMDSLHSSEPKQMMSRYRVGRIEGRWKNFLPPIQGGKFRKMVEGGGSGGGEEDEREREREREEKAAVSPSSSDDASRSPSPVFDTNTLDAGETCFRRRSKAT